MLLGFCVKVDAAVQRCGSRTVEPSGGSSRGRGRTWSGDEGGTVAGEGELKGRFFWGGEGVSFGEGTG